MLSADSFVVLSAVAVSRRESPAGAKLYAISLFRFQLLSFGNLPFRLVAKISIRNPSLLLIGTNSHHLKILNHVENLQFAMTRNQYC